MINLLILYALITFLAVVLIGIISWKLFKQDREEEKNYSDEVNEKLSMYYELSFD